MKKALRLNIQLSLRLETNVCTPAVTGKCDEISGYISYEIHSIFIYFFLFVVRRMCGNCVNMSRIRGRARWTRSMQCLYLTKEKW